MISFIIPYFNGHKTIENCLKSIYSQTSTEKFEIIVVDNNSSKKSYFFLENLNYPIKLYQETTLQGAGFARNKGAKLAKGDYLAFIDCDVVLDKNWLKTLKEYMDKFNLDIAQGRILRQALTSPQTVLDEYRMYMTNIKKKYEGIDLVKKDGSTDVVINTAACIYDKKLFHKVGGFFPYKAYEDYDLSRRSALFNGKIGATTQCSAHVYFCGSLFKYLKREFIGGQWCLYYFLNTYKMRPKNFYVELQSVNPKLIPIHLLCSFANYCGQIFGYIYQKPRPKIQSRKLQALLSLNLAKDDYKIRVDDTEYNPGLFFKTVRRSINEKKTRMGN